MSTRRGLLMTVLVAGALAGAADAAPMAEVRPSPGVAASGQMLSVAIDIDMATTGHPLGSYGAALRWNPAYLHYMSDSGGGVAPFDGATVNRSDVGAGILRFADASAAGAGGRINVQNITFLVIAEPCLTAQLDLSVTSLFSADTLQNLLPVFAVHDGAVNVNDFFLNLQVIGASDTFLSWNAIAGASSYDVIRGEVASIFDDGASIRLGSVVCLENGSFDTTTGPGTEPANPDVAQPLPGEAFFYLVRHFDGTNHTYGFLPQCLRERLADAGDCP